MWKVLIVDDDFVNRKFLVEILRGSAECDVAADGDEAIAAYDLSIKANDPYDAFLLDVSMPGKSGMDVLAYIRAKEAENGVLFGMGVPVIMTTAHSEPFLEAFNMGCDDYILKPINAKLLLTKIEEKIQKK